MPQSGSIDATSRLAADAGALLVGLIASLPCFLLLSALMWGLS